MRTFISGVLALVGFLLCVGTAGGVDNGTISFATCWMHLCIGCALMFCGYLVGGDTE